MADVTLLHLLNFLDDENDDAEDRHSPPIDFVTTTDHNDDLYWSSEFDFYVSDLSSDIQPSHLFPRPQNSISHRQSLVFDPFDDDYVSNPESSADLLTRENQVNFIIDLLHQRVEQSQWSTEHVILDPEHDPILDLNFGVIEGNEEMGSAQLDIDLGLGFFEESNSLNDERLDFVGENVEDEHRLVTRLQVVEIGSNTDSDLNLDGIGFNADGIRLRSVDIGSDSDSDSDLDLNLDGINFNADDVQDASGDDNDDQSLGLCCDSFQIEDHRVFMNQEFDWEEVVEEGIDEGEVLTMSLMVREERTSTVGNLEWEVLLDVQNVEANPDTGHEGFNEFSFGDDELDEYLYNYATDYDMFFGHIGEGEIAILGRPPAAKDVVKNLPLIVLTKEDVEKDNVTCAVCRDEMEAGETATQLSCCHKFHGDCISPWLGIRNTCPVCRLELPTDDPEYEKRRRALGSNQIH